MNILIQISVGARIYRYYYINAEYHILEVFCAPPFLILEYDGAYVASALIHIVIAVVGWQTAQTHTHMQCTANRLIIIYSNTRICAELIVAHFACCIV